MNNQSACSNTTFMEKRDHNAWKVHATKIENKDESELIGHGTNYKFLFLPLLDKNIIQLIQVLFPQFYQAPPQIPPMLISRRCLAAPQ